MKTIYLIYPPEDDTEEQGVVSVFDKMELAQAFINRHPRFHGRYTIEEMNLNPHFVVTDDWFYMVSLDPDKTEPGQAFALTAFEDETQVYTRPVQKCEGNFFMYLFARDQDDAIQQANQKFQEMSASGEWQIMPDEADEYDEEGD